MTIGYDEFAHVAQKLGLRIDPPEKKLLAAEHAITGIVDGVYVHVWQWQGQFVHLEYSAYIDPPADLRLVIEPEGITSKLGHFLGRHDIEVGDPELDAAYGIKADEPERAKKLFTPELREILRAWNNASVKLRITDEKVFMWSIPGAYSTVSMQELENDIRAIAKLARAIGRALPALPSSEMFASHVETWRSFAGLRGLEFSPSPLRVVGRLDGSDIAVRATAIDDHAYGVDLRLRFQHRLPWALGVRPSRFFDFLDRGDGVARTIEIGDARFDNEFRVTTTEEAKTRAFLDNDVCSALCALHDADGDVTLDSESLSVRTRSMTEPSMFGPILDRVAVVARKLHERVGPYR